jgi:protein-disulfide isomerase
LPGALGQQPTAEIATLRKEIESLQAGQRQLQSDIRLIKNMLLGKQVAPEAPPLQDVTIGIAGAASIGSPEAKVVLVEFSDYLCPFCGRYANDTFWNLAKSYVNNGKIQYVFRNFPLQEAHPAAEKAAEAAECAGEQGKYWEAHEKLFRSQLTLDSRPLAREVASMGIDPQRFLECLDTGKFASRIRADIAEGSRIGIDATPTFFFGYRDEKEPTKIKALKMLTGAQPVTSFTQILEYLLDPPPADGENR